MEINGKKITTGQDLKNALGPEKWDKFCGILAENLAPKVAANLREQRLKENLLELKKEGFFADLN